MELKALLKEKPERGFVLKEVDIPPVGPGDVLVRVEAAAICRSDIHLYLWDEWAKKVFKRLPLIGGHEFCGTVESVGVEVSGFAPGERVAGETHIPCGSCYQCRTGLRHICQRLELFGHTTNGCFAEYCVIPAVSAKRIDTRIPVEFGALLEPMGVSLRAVASSEALGEPVAIFGCGPVGQFAVALARLAGASAVFAVDMNPKRLEIALQMGATHVLNPDGDRVDSMIIEATGGVGCGVVIECSGSERAIACGFASLRKGGRFFFLGNPTGTVPIDIMRDIIHKETLVKGFHGREMYKTWEAAERVLANKLIDIEPVITHRVRLSEFETGFLAILQGNACKVVLLPHWETASKP